MKKFLSDNQILIGLILLNLIVYLMSCQKFNATIREARVNEGWDNKPHGSMVCDSNFHKIDTIKVAYSVENPSGPWSRADGRSRLSMKEYDSAGIHWRRFHEFLNWVQ